MKEKICAVIELSPMGVKCKIAQRTQKGFSILESIDYYMEISSDPSFDEMDKLCKILNNLKNNLKTYDLNKQNVKLYAVSSIGENKNRSFMQDIIKTKTGFNLIFLDLKLKNTLIYKKIISEIGSSPLLEDTTIIAGIDYGHITLVLLEKGRIIYTENFSLGTIKIREIIKNINYNPHKVDSIIEEYFLSYLKILKNQLPSKEIKNLIIRGSLFELVNSNILTTNSKLLPFTTKEKFINNLNELKEHSVEELADKFEIIENKVELIIPKLSFSKILMELLEVKRIYSLNLSLIDAMIYRSLYTRESSRFNKQVYESIILSSKQIAKKYLYDENHAENVKFLSLKIFDLMKKEHNFTNKDMMLLEAACYLHDIGKFLSLKEHYKHSYQLIKGTTIFGISLDELEIIALLSYFHSKKIPIISSKMFKTFDEPTKMKISKLISILRMADSLDRSHKQKIKDISFEINDHTLTIYVKCKEKLIIENWSFEKKSNLFQKIFGLRPQIKMKN